MNHINNRRVHRSCRNIVIRSKQQFAKWATQLLRIRNVDSDEFQDTVLCNDAEHVGSLSLTIAGNEGNTTGARFEHAPTRIIQRALRVDGDGLWRRDAERLFDICHFISRVCIQ